MLAPVVLFVYNRLEHTIDVLESLSKNLLAKDTELFVFSDAAKSEKGLEKVNEVREYINRKNWQSSFQSVTIIQAEKNKGLANSVIDGVSEIIEKYGKVIAVEDDLILSPYFLKYMNGALDYYQNDSQIWSISGYSFPMKCLQRYSHDVFYSYRGCSWGWATWSDRWQTVDWEARDYYKMRDDEKWIERFNRGGVDLADMLTMQMEGKIDSWAIRWCFSQSNQEKYTVYPKNSYLQNSGCDGTHSGNNDKFHTNINDCVLECKYESLGIEKRLAKEFQKKYKDTISDKVKRKLKKLFRVK